MPDFDPDTSPSPPETSAPPEWTPGTDELRGIGRGRMTIEFRADDYAWALSFRETPDGIYVRMNRSYMNLSPEQADAPGDFLTRARRIRERIRAEVRGEPS